MMRPMTLPNGRPYELEPGDLADPAAPEAVSWKTNVTGPVGATNVGLTADAEDSETAVPDTCVHWYVTVPPSEPGEVADPSSVTPLPEATC